MTRDRLPSPPRTLSTRAIAFGIIAAALLAPLHGGAQERPATVKATDPRVGLKAGLRNAGIAARNMELVASLPKPKGFFDPKAPAGEHTGPEPPPEPGPGAPPASAPAPPSAPTPPAASGGGGLAFANSDLAFSKDRLVMGNFNGFNSYDIKDPRKPKLIGSVACPGGQGDVSIHGNLLFMSVEQTRGRLDCGSGGVQPVVSADRFRGVRIFDITDLRNPKQVAAVQTCRGSHTHTLVTTPKDPAHVYIYGSGTSTVRASEELAGCSALDPKEDPNTSLFSIDVIEVPVASPDKARVVNQPRIFADPATGAVSGLWPGGDFGAGTQTSRVTNQCHDITVYPALGLAAGACSGNGILLDISDPVRPVRLDAVTDKNFAYWHSATFNNDGSKVIFTDEWGGGTRPRCRATDLPNWGANAIFEVADRKLRFAGYFKMPAAQAEQENCVAHNGSIIPVPGRDIMVQAWYQGGISVFDFTDAAHPIEIAYFDRGPVDAAHLITGGFWSAYWYNGRIYGTEIARGLDVFRLTASEHLSQHEIDAASQVRADVFNAQLQPRIVWPATTVVARAYLDQLARTKAVQPSRAVAVVSALERADKANSARDGAAAIAGQLEALSADLSGDAGKAGAVDAARIRALASVLRARAEALR